MKQLYFILVFLGFTFVSNTNGGNVKDSLVTFRSIKDVKMVEKGFILVQNHIIQKKGKFKETLNPKVELESYVIIRNYPDSESIHFLIKVTPTLNKIWFQIFITNSCENVAIESNHDDLNSYDDAKAELAYSIAKKRNYTIQKWGALNNYKILNSKILTEIKELIKIIPEIIKIISKLGIFEVNLLHIQDSNYSSCTKENQPNTFFLLYIIEPSSNFFLVLVEIKQNKPHVKKLCISSFTFGPKDLQLILSTFFAQAVMELEKMNKAEEATIQTITCNVSIAAPQEILFRSRSVNNPNPCAQRLPRITLKTIKNSNTILTPFYYAFHNELGKSLTSSVLVVYQLLSKDQNNLDEKFMLAVIPVSDGKFKVQEIQCFMMDVKSDSNTIQLHKNLINELRIHLARIIKCEPIQMYNWNYEDWKLCTGVYDQRMSKSEENLKIIEEIAKKIGFPNLKSMGSKSWIKLQPLLFAIDNSPKYNCYYILYQLDSTEDSEKKIPIDKKFIVVTFKTNSVEFYKPQDSINNASLELLKRLMKHGDQNLMEWFRSPITISLKYMLPDPILTNDLPDELKNTNGKNKTVEKYTIKQIEYGMNWTDENGDPLNKQITIIYEVNGTVTLIGKDKKSFKTETSYFYITVDINTTLNTTMLNKTIENCSKIKKVGKLKETSIQVKQEICGGKREVIKDI